MPKRTAPRSEHNYTRKLRYLLRVGALPLGTGVYSIDVLHDSWCGIYKARRCNCNPDIKLGWTQPDASKNEGGCDGSCPVSPS